jgi:hypothetical protein
VFGDSYTTPDVCVTPKESFWGLLSTHLGISTINNCSRICNSFDSICQLLVGLQTDIHWDEDIVLIGIPPLERITVFNNYENTEYLGYTFDTQSWQFDQFDIECHKGLVSLQRYGEDKQLIIHNDRSWLETQALQKLFFLTTWLDGLGANYMILNLSKPLDIDNVWGPSNIVLPYALNHPRCILFKDTYHGINLNINQPADFDQYGWNGHHGPIGNQYFFEKSLLPTMQRNGLC